jgi:hypothetical protein
MPRFGAFAPNAQETTGRRPKPLAVGLAGANRTNRPLEKRRSIRKLLAVVPQSHR